MSVDHGLLSQIEPSAEQVARHNQRELQRNNNEDKPRRGAADCGRHSVKAVGKISHGEGTAGMMT